jgi:hypothetical protein
MITLGTGALPQKCATGVYEIIKYLRELSGNADDDNFTELPDEITIHAVRISMPNVSFVEEIFGCFEYHEMNPNKLIRLRILDRNPRSPKVMLYFGDPDNPDIQHEELKLSLTFNPFKDIKRIEEYKGATPKYPDEEHILIKAVFENMELTFLKWKKEREAIEQKQVLAPEQEGSDPDISL